MCICLLWKPLLPANIATPPEFHLGKLGFPAASQMSENKIPHHTTRLMMINYLILYNCFQFGEMEIVKTMMFLIPHAPFLEI